MHIIFCIICTLLVYSVSAQRSAFIGNDSTYNMVRELQEVIVTAEKRQLNPVNIPTALTVVTPKIITGENSLDLRNISGIALAKLPSLLLVNKSLAACNIVGLLTELIADTLSTIAWNKVS